MAEEAQKAAFERQKAAFHALPREPPAKAAGIATLRFRLPRNVPVPPAFEQIPEENRPQITNDSIIRRFRGSDSLKDIKNFMEFLGYSVNDFRLLRTFPRVDVGPYWAFKK